ncbi:hypothetical protein CLTEP_07510 [Clostridium tepidiprofundi DSM 19306]|uniref:ABC-2 family transporter protein n=1 Tax=Clostridium tepidiprofundi DSM 19306 TaxID=1121338 RepID=A0A151B6S5_9CLOT|nr:hypothetical protein [Clostridium tepidiprofundi]KYH35347.1 hypothetical protein CLTEP_07510 [Clostridium tepidiprofundi DSM 19306]
MNRFIALTKVLFKNTGSSIVTNGNTKQKLKSYLIVLFLIVCFLPMAISLGAFTNKAYGVLSSINQEGLILGLGFGIGSMLIFIFGIFYVMGTFYFSMDIENLLHLPFKPSDILGAKFVIVLAFEYLTEFVVLLPILIGYGVGSKGGVLYYLYSFITFLTLPVVPLIIASLIVMVIMRFTNIAKNKDRFKVVGGMIAIVISVAINLFIQRTSQSGASTEEIKNMIISGNNSLIGLATKIFPNSKFAAYGVAQSSNLSGAVNMLVFLIIAIAAIIIFILVGDMLYLKGVIGISETTSRRKKLTSDELKKNTKQNSIIKSYTIKEIRILLRTPAYFMNCVLMNFLWPVVILIPMFTNSNGMSDIHEFGKFILKPDIIGTALACAVAIVVVITASSPVASTAISREGHNFFTNKYLPVDYRIQIMSKVFSAFILGIFSMLILLVVLIPFIRPSVILVVLIVLAGTLGILFSSFTGVLVDINSPKLNWDNEQKAVKQNLNVFLGMLPCLVYSGAIAFIVFKFKLSIVVASVILVGAFGVIDIILYRFLMTKGVSMYGKIN